VKRARRPARSWSLPMPRRPQSLPVACRPSGFPGCPNSVRSDCICCGRAGNTPVPKSVGAGRRTRRTTAPMPSSDRLAISSPTVWCQLSSASTIGSPDLPRSRRPRGRSCLPSLRAFFARQNLFIRYREARLHSTSRAISLSGISGATTKMATAFASLVRIRPLGVISS
jgi:hypothetical protein